MKKSRILAAAAALTLALGLGACASGSTGADKAESTPKAGGTLTIANYVDNNSFDPAALEIGHRVQYWMPVYDTLLVLDKDANPEPNLVTEWTYNDDNTILNLKLRDDVTFTDGTAFDAAAVQANLEHLAAGTGQNAYMAKSIASFDTVSDTELNLVLAAPDPGLLGYLGVVGGAMASPASLTAADVATNPVGSGPYVLDQDQTSVGSQYVYTRNKDYWNAAAFPYDKIIVKPMADLTARLNAIKSGQVNVALADAKSITEAEASGLQVNRSSVNWSGLFLADRAGTMVPALADVRVRQAINMAFDTDAMLKNIARGEGSLTNQIFNPTANAYDKSLNGTYKFDVDKAKKLMKDAGYADGFTLPMPELTGFEALSPLIDQSLGELNITVQWTKVAPDATIPSLLGGKFPVFFFTLGSQSSWQDINKALLPKSPWNPFHVEDPDLTALIKTAQTATGKDQDKAMQAVNAWAVDNAWFAPWYREEAIYLSDAKTNVVMEAQNVVPWIRGITPAS